MQYANILTSSKKPKRNHLLLVILAFCIIGAIFVIRSFAATYTTAQAEDIQFSRKAVQQDSSKGKIAALYWGASGSTNVTVPTTTTKLVVDARAQNCEGSPKMLVQIDGQTVFDTVIPQESWQAYSIPVNLQRGTYVVTIAFTNDFAKADPNDTKRITCDRNLFLDKLVFVGNDKTPTTPTVLEAEDMSRGNLIILSDGQVQNDRALTFWTNSTANGSVVLPRPATQLVAHVKGSQCGGKPKLRVQVDGKDVINKGVGFSNWGQISANLKDLAPGEHRVTVSFTNDYVRYKYGRLTCDRNLYVDKIVFESPMPPQQPVVRVPAAPTALQVVRYENKTVTLQAQVSSTTVTAGVGYTINGKSGPPVPDPSNANGVVTFSIPNIEPSSTIVMKVAGKNAAGVGPESAALSYIVPGVVPTPGPGPGPQLTGNVIGLHTGARDIDYRATQSLRPRLVRVGGLSADMSRAQIDTIAKEYAKTNTRIIALVDFNGAAPSEAVSRNVGTWANVPGVEAIEFGNEPWLQNEAWDYAQYARSFKAAQQAVNAVNPNMTLIAVGDSANRSHRPGLRVMQALKAVGVKPKAIQIHPYGPNYINRLQDARRDLADVGWANQVEIWVTEVGLSTDNGRIVRQGGAANNYGWNTSMSYAEASQVITKVTSDLQLQGIKRIILYMGTDYRSPGSSDEREYFFGLTKADGSDKGELSATARRLFNP